MRKIIFIEGLDQVGKHPPRRRAMWSSGRYSVCLAVSCSCASLGSPPFNNICQDGDNGDNEDNEDIEDIDNDNDNDNDNDSDSNGLQYNGPDSAPPPRIH